MSLIVIDSSVAVKWLLPEPGRAEALELLDYYEAGTTDLIAPRLLSEEVASALSKRCRRREITAAKAEQMFALFNLRRPRIVDEPWHLDVALSLSLKHHLSLWDSLYLALAVEKRADLITADHRLYRSVARRYPFVKLLGAENLR
jgi:predicted nucleic acid-binding protein